MKKETLRIPLVQAIASSLFLMIFILLTNNSYGQTTVYIDPSYTGSTQNGTMANPYKSWNSVTWVNGNTYLQKAGTTFNTTGSLTVSSKSNITIGAYGTGNKPKIISSASSTSKVINITSSSNIQVNELEVASTSGMVAAVIISGTGAGNNLINNCILRDVQWGIRILTTSAGNRILNCEVFNTQDDGIYIKDTPDIEIGYCNIYNVNLKYFVNPDQSYSPGDNIQIASTNSHNFYIHHNTLDHSTTGNKFCFIAWGNNYTGILEYNTMIGHSNKSVTCMYLSPTTGTVTARYNSFINGNYGVYSYVSNFQVYYNEFINSRIAISVLNNYHLLAENNVFYNSTANNINSLSGSTVVSKNNIFYLTGSAKAYSTSGSLTSNNNVFNVQSAGFINGHSTLASWRSASGQDMNSMVANPNFVNHAAHNFTLQQNSPCINAGNLCGYNQDYFGNSVPQGSSSDIGYHEFTTSTNNQAPIIQSQTFSVPENSPNGTVVGQVIASDPDAGQTITYSITGGNTSSAFNINTTTGVLSVANTQILNYEGNPTFNLQVTVLDNMNSSASATVIVNLQDVNENPVINDQGFNINENIPNGSAVGTIVATDPDNGQQLTYSITSGNTNSTFALNASSGALTVNNNQLLNHETNNQFQLTVKVQDNGAGMLSDYGTITVNILDVNEAPVVANQNFSVNSNASNGTNVGQVIASDPDDNQALSYSIISGNNNNAFIINSNTGIISINNSVALSTSSSFSLSVRVTDNGTPQLSSNCIVTITVTSSGNSAPVINAQSFSVNENSSNGTVLGQVVASDPNNGQVLSYSILSGNTSGAFFLSSQGVLSVANSSALNYEVQPSFNLVVRVTDNGSPQLSAQNNITINVLDINEAPVIANQSFSVISTASNGTNVGQVIASDPDNNQALSYSIISGNNNNAFIINSNNGIISVNNSAALSTSSSFSLSVRVTDNGIPQLSSNCLVTITVTSSGNSAPVINAQSFSVNENSSNGTVLGQVIASDPNNGQVLSYSILSGNTSGAFFLSSQGVLSVANSSALNYEVQPSFNLVVRVTDNGSPQLSAQNNITINVLDINEAPFVIANQNFDLLTTAPNGYQIGIVLSDDPDMNQTVQYAIIGGNTHSAFAINQTTGMLTVANASALKKLSNRTVSLNVQVTDNGTPSLSSSGVVKIKVYKGKDVSIDMAGLERGVEGCNVYPNPSNDGNFTIEMDQKEETQIALRVSDINGSILYTTTTHYTGNYKLNLSHLPKGIYLLQVIKEGSSEIKKLIIQ